MTNKLRVLMIGAHPDDTDIKCGGIAALYADAGHTVKMVSVTDGAAGHQTNFGPKLAQRRREESCAAGAVLRVEYVTLDNSDGALQPTLEIRNELITIIRQFKPDLLFTHRPNDYHPDHRVTSQLVQDASYLLTVPAVVPATAHLSEMPVILYFFDNFQKPSAFEPDVLVDIDSVIERKFEALHCHTSQVYEWLPFNQKHLHLVPREEEPRKKWLRQHWDSRFRESADFFRQELIERYGIPRGRTIKYAEAFENCEYGTPLTSEYRALLFPFG